jgi:hypothetical protein
MVDKTTREAYLIDVAIHSSHNLCSSMHGRGEAHTQTFVPAIYSKELTWTTKKRKGVNIVIKLTRMNKSV